MKLFQIEEPDGGPLDPSAPGASIGIDASGAEVVVAFAVGGNALVLTDREGFQRAVPVPQIAAAATGWQEFFESARIRGERTLGRPVSHAVLVLAGELDHQRADRLRQAAAQAGVELLRFVARTELPAGSTPALAAAVLAEDLAPRAKSGA